MKTFLFIVFALAAAPLAAQEASTQPEQRAPVGTTIVTVNGTTYTVVGNANPEQSSTQPAAVTTAAAGVQIIRSDGTIITVDPNAPSAPVTTSATATESAPQSTLRHRIVVTSDGATTIIQAPSDHQPPAPTSNDR